MGRQSKEEQIMLYEKVDVYTLSRLISVDELDERLRAQLSNYRARVNKNGRVEVK